MLRDNRFGCTDNRFGCTESLNIFPNKWFDEDYNFILGSYNISSMYTIRTELKMSIKFNVFLCSLSGFNFRASR